MDCEYGEQASHERESCELNRYRKQPHSASGKHTDVPSQYLEMKNPDQCAYGQPCAGLQQ
jgi:hypothetical protein